MKRAVFSLILGNILSKFLGFAREVFLAAWFGTNDVAAAYRVAISAFNIPTQALIGESLSAGVIPIYRRHKDENSGADADGVILAALVLGAAISAFISVALLFFPGAIVKILAPGMPSEVADLAIKFIRVIAVAIPFFVLSGTLGYLEASHGKFGALSWRSILLNIAGILGACAAWISGQTLWLVLSIVIGNAMFFGVTLRQSFLLLGKNWLSASRDTRIFKNCTALLKRLSPLIIIPMIAQSNLVIERSVASLIGVATIPALDYSRFLMDTWVNILALPLGVYTITSKGGRDAEAMREHVTSNVLLLLAISFPIGFFSAAFAFPIIKLVYGHGAFDATSQELTSSIFIWLGLSLGFMTTSYYMQRTLTAQLRFRLAAAAVLLSCAANSAFNLLFWKALGPQTLGIGVLIYSFLLFTLTAKFLGLWQNMAPLIAPIVAIFIGTILLRLTLSHFISSTSLLIICATILEACMCFAVICGNHRYRAAVSPLLRRKKMFGE